MDGKERMEELCLEIVEKNEQICTIKFQNFLGAMPPGPRLRYWGGATAPLSRPHPLGTTALRASVPR